MDTKLLERYIAGEATEREKQLITEWLNKDEDNMREFMALRKLYNITLWQTEDKKIKDERGRTSRHIMLLKEALKIAAIFTILALGAYYWIEKERDKYSATWQTIHVPAGQRAEIFLSDGTKVWLNSKSSLSFPATFVTDTRGVKLDGEGYFQVTADKEKPFIVETEKYNIKVLGTEFNTIAYSASPYFETSLIKGSVEVFLPGKGKGVVLEPDSKVTLTDGKLKKSYFSDHNYFMWREGIISFVNESVKDMFEKLELYYDVKIIVNNTQILANRYTGKFRTKDGVEQVLKVLQLNNKFSYIKDDEQNTIYIN